MIVKQLKKFIKQHNYRRYSTLLKSKLLEVVNAIKQDIKPPYVSKCAEKVQTRSITERIKCNQIMGGKQGRINGLSKEDELTKLLKTKGIFEKYTIKDVYKCGSTFVKDLTGKRKPRKGDVCVKLFNGDTIYISIKSGACNTTQAHITSLENTLKHIIPYNTLNKQDIKMMQYFFGTVHKNKVRWKRSELREFNEVEEKLHQVRHSILNYVLIGKGCFHLPDHSTRLAIHRNNTWYIYNTEDMIDKMVLDDLKPSCRNGFMISNYIIMKRKGSCNHRNGSVCPEMRGEVCGQRCGVQFNIDKKKIIDNIMPMYTLYI